MCDSGGRCWSPDPENMKLLGRTLLHEEPAIVSSCRSVRYLCHSGAYVEFVFTGRSLSCRMISDYAPDHRDGAESPCYMALYADGQRIRRFRLKSGMHCYSLLAEGDYRDVVIRLFKDTEVQYASSGIVDFQTNDWARLFPTARKKKAIEFIGDSITCGYGVLGKPGDAFSTETESADHSYAVRCAHLLGADYQLVSFSGIGVISRYVEPDRNEPLTDVLMPDIYPQTDPVLCRRHGWVVENWDFQSFCPQVIVVNLGTNDASYTRGIREREKLFCRKYTRFLEEVHRRNPDAEIVCTLGVMDQQLVPAVIEAVEMLVARSVPVLMHREKALCLRNIQTSEEGGRVRQEESLVLREMTGCDGHPSARAQREMAENLKNFICSNTRLGRE